MDRVLDHLSVAEKLAAALGDDARRSRVAAALSNTFFSKRWLDRAVETGTQALRLSEVQADVALQVSATCVSERSTISSATIGRRPAP